MTGSLYAREVPMQRGSSGIRARAGCGKMPRVGSLNSAEQWFTGDAPRTEDEARFLTRVRERSVTWAVPGLESAASWSLAKLVCLLLVVASPSLDGLKGLHSVQVGYYPPGNPLRLEGEWGDDHLLDNGGDEHDLRLAGVEGEPEWFADIAADWMQRQLLRPLERREWLDGSTVVAQQTRLSDSGFLLARSGSRFRSRRAPDRTLRLN